LGSRSETPEGFDLLIKALDESRKTRSDEKRDLIAQILRGALTDYEDKYSPEEYLYLISDLTVQEPRVALSIYDDRPDTRAEPWSKWIDEVCTQTGIDKTDLHLSLERIASTGLLQKATTHTDDRGRLYVSVPAYGEGSSFLVTTAFDWLMESLQLRT
jgi:DNA-binding MarR family transcriptional regulator